MGNTSELEEPGIPPSLETMLLIKKNTAKDKKDMKDKGLKAKEKLMKKEKKSFKYPCCFSGRGML